MYAMFIRSYFCLQVKREPSIGAENIFILTQKIKDDNI